MAACIIITARPIDLASLPSDILEPIASRPFMAQTSDRDIRRAQRESLRDLYADYQPTRHETYRDRYNSEAERASLALFMKRRNVR